jgi:hypothetical protein
VSSEDTEASEAPRREEGGKFSQAFSDEDLLVAFYDESPKSVTAFAETHSIPLRTIRRRIAALRERKLISQKALKLTPSGVHLIEDRLIALEDDKLA